MRVWFTTEGWPVLDFTVQYEAYIEGQHRPVVRYDCHNGPHRDLLDWAGNTIDKRFMRTGIIYNQALNEAIADIVTNWERYRDDFLRRRP
jgi:hypothetical protein